MAAEISDEAVSQLMATTGADLDQACFLLEAANGNVDAAAHMFYGGARGGPGMAGWARARAPPRHAHAHTRAAAPACQGQRGRGPRPDDPSLQRPPARRAPAEHLPAASLPAGAGRADAAVPAHPEHAPPPRPRAPTAAAPPPGARVAQAYPQRRPGQQGGGGLLGRVLQLPLFVLRTAMGVVTSVAHLGVALATLAGDAVLPRSVMQRARGEPGRSTGVAPVLWRSGGRGCLEPVERAPPFLMRCVEAHPARLHCRPASRPLTPPARRPPAAIVSSVAAASGPPPDPAQQAADFIAAYRAAYGDRAPAFVAQGWSQATSTAHGQFKFLLALLHSPEHEVRLAASSWRRGAVGGTPPCCAEVAAGPRAPAAASRPRRRLTPPASSPPVPRPPPGRGQLLPQRAGPARGPVVHRGGVCGVGRRHPPRRRVHGGPRRAQGVAWTPGRRAPASAAGAAGAAQRLLKGKTARSAALHRSQPNPNFHRPAPHRPAQLSSRLHVTTYPCVALLAYPGARTKVVACLQGRFTAAQLLTALRRAVEEHGVLLATERLQQEERVRGRRGAGRGGRGRWCNLRCPSESLREVQRG
jgi:hypothetical protein